MKPSFTAYYHHIIKLYQTYQSLQIIIARITTKSRYPYFKLSYRLGIINHRLSESGTLTTFSSLKYRLGLADLLVLGCFIIPKLSSCCIIIRVIKSFREINLAIQLEDSRRPGDILRSKLKAISRPVAASDSITHSNLD